MKSLAFVVLLAAVVVAQDERKEAGLDDWIESLLFGTIHEQETAAEKLAHQGKKAVGPLNRAYEKAPDADARRRVKEVLLCNKARTYEISESIEDMTVRLQSLDMKIGMVDTVGKREIKETMLQISVTISLVNDHREAQKIYLTKASLITENRRVPLKLKKGTGWRVDGHGSGRTIYHAMERPHWKEGTLAIVLMEFKHGKKRVKVRTPAEKIIGSK